MGAYLIYFVMFTSNLMHSVVWNQSLHFLNSLVISLILLVYIIFANHLSITSSLTSTSVSFYSSPSSTHTSYHHSSFVLHLLLLWLIKQFVHCLPLPLKSFFIPSAWFLLHHHLPTHPPPPISPTPGYCPESSSVMSHLYLFSKATSPHSLKLPSLNSSSTNLWPPPYSTSSHTTSFCLSTS